MAFMSLRIADLLAARHIKSPLTDAMLDVSMSSLIALTDGISGMNCGLTTAASRMAKMKSPTLASTTTQLTNVQVVQPL